MSQKLTKEQKYPIEISSSKVLWRNTQWGQWEVSNKRTTHNGKYSQSFSSGLVWKLYNKRKNVWMTRISLILFAFLVRSSHSRIIYKLGMEAKKTIEVALNIVGCSINLKFFWHCSIKVCDFMLTFAPKVSGINKFSSSSFHLHESLFLKSPLTFRRNKARIWVINQNKQWSWMPKNCLIEELPTLLFTLKHEKEIRG